MQTSPRSWLWIVLPTAVALHAHAGSTAGEVSGNETGGFDVVIVQDVSRSVATATGGSRMEAAVVDFLTANSVYLTGSSAKLIQFGRTVNVVFDRIISSEMDVQALADVISRAEKTDFWSETTAALSMALESATARIQHDSDGRVLIILITDGLFDPSPASKGVPTIRDVQAVLNASPLRPRENLFVWLCWTGRPDQSIHEFAHDELRGRVKTADELVLPVIRGFLEAPTASVCVGDFDWSTAWKLSAENAVGVLVELQEPTWNPELPLGAVVTIEPTEVLIREGKDSMSVPIRLSGHFPTRYEGTARIGLRSPGILSVLAPETLTFNLESDWGRMTFRRRDAGGEIELYVGESPVDVEFQFVPADDAKLCGSVKLSVTVSDDAKNHGVALEIDPSELEFDPQTRANLDFSVAGHSAA